jgi:hypothetical protein
MCKLTVEARDFLNRQRIGSERQICAPTKLLYTENLNGQLQEKRGLLHELRGECLWDGKHRLVCTHSLYASVSCIYILIPDMISQMPALRELAVLFTADSKRKPWESRPPFTLGQIEGPPFSAPSSYLNSVALSNMKPADPIFR